MRRGDRDPERRRQIPPRATTGQDEHNRSEHRTVIHRCRVSTLRTRIKPGINGCASAHSSSETNRRDRSSTTETIMILPALMPLLGDKSWWPSRAVLRARAAAPRSR
jgi:hypothetical protein